MGFFYSLNINITDKEIAVRSVKLNNPVSVGDKISLDGMMVLVFEVIHMKEGDTVLACDLM